jgi:hypothetical protein
MHQSADLLGELANRRNFVDRSIEDDGAARHVIEGGLSETLNQRLAAGLLQGDKPLGAVFQQAGQDDANGSSAGVPGQGAEQQVDIVAAVEAIMDQIRHQTWADRQMTVGAAEIAFAWPKLFPLPRDNDWESANLRENMVQLAFALHRPMERDKHRCRKIGRQSVQQLGKRLDAAGRSTDRHDVEGMNLHCREVKECWDISAAGTPKGFDLHQRSMNFGAER